MWDGNNAAPSKQISPGLANGRVVSHCFFRASCWKDSGRFGRFYHTVYIYIYIYIFISIHMKWIFSFDCSEFIEFCSSSFGELLSVLLLLLVLLLSLLFFFFLDRLLLFELLFITFSAFIVVILHTLTNETNSRQSQDTVYRDFPRTYHLEQDF